MDEKKALEIFEKNVSMKICKIERCRVGHGNYVYIISGDMDKYVIRCSEEDNAYIDTIYWLKKLNKVNIPVPEIIAYGKYQNYNYIILSYMAGEDLGIVYPTLSNDEKRIIAREVVRIQTKVATIELEDIEADWTWNTFIVDMLERAKERIAMNGYFDINKVEQIWKMSEALQDYFNKVKPIAYLDDISTKNLLIENGRISGVIDLDWIGVGDKLTYAALTNVALLNMDYDTDYVEFLLEEMNVNQVEKKAFIYYSLLFCVDFMGERGMQFGDKRIDVNDMIISRLNEIYDKLIIEWNRLNS
ncbi:MAG: aminoglycoside phosphotransferase family protein [Lachnospiraceae bacterium]|nr:aminoglycoside phosphotransferase family protein [Lachnospiraceae bacterium]